MSSVLLLNPPGKRLYIRDYFCSKVSQADYVHHPIDLVILSGILDGHADLAAIDAIAGDMSVDRTLHAIAAQRPDAVIMLMGSVSLGEDALFLQRLREVLPNAKIICSGDIFAEAGERHLRAMPQIDAALLDFTSPEILSCLSGGASQYSALITRHADGTPRLPAPPGARVREFSPGVPRHDLFLPFNYRHPFVRARRFATTVIDYGCPYPCSFCIMGTLPYRTRPVDSVMKELSVIRDLGITEVLLDTQTFGIPNSHALELCRRLIDAKLSLGFTCFSRVDVTTPELLDLMKQAGFHTIMYGVESGSARILRHYKKGYTPEQIHRAIDYAASIGFETVGTFILGLPEETEETIQETLATLRRIRLDYASFNVAVPRAGTGLRREAIDLGLTSEDVTIMDQSGTEVSMPTKTLSREAIQRFRRKAVVTFYFRPSYLLRRLRAVRSLPDLMRNARQAVSLVRQTWLA
jgi:anaerobic magnesium-protoporphyrin IX monomethyl ester cyclase